MKLVTSLSEAEAGLLAGAKGRKVVEHGSRHWEQVKPGFFEPVHLLGAVAEPDTARPTVACWGCRAVVSPESNTNGRLVVYFIDDVPGFDVSALSGSRRHKLHRAQRSTIRLFPLTDDTLLQREGYAICVSAYRRFGGRPPTAEQYARWMAAQDIGRRTSGVAATLDGRLVGYDLAHVIDGVAYLGDFHVETEVLRTNVSTALSFELLAMLRDSGAVTSAWNGNVSPDDEGMTRFKTSMGYRVATFPTRLHLWPGTGSVLRRWRPDRYQRLTGDVVLT